jgi:hypothetical protein
LEQHVSFNFEFEYKINGRKVSQDEWIRHMGEEAKAKPLKGLPDEIRADVSRLRCPVHGESPKVVESSVIDDTGAHTHRGLLRRDAGARAADRCWSVSTAREWLLDPGLS